MFGNIPIRTHAAQMATSHTLYRAKPDDMEDDNVDIDSGYSNNTELNSSCSGSGNSVDITGDHSQHGSHSEAHAAAPLAASQAKLTALWLSPQPTDSQ